MKKQGKRCRNDLFMNLAIYYFLISRIFTRRRRILNAEEPYKLEILEGLKDAPTISIYSIGSHWWDLCAGPHVDSTGHIDAKAIEIQSIAGAYWKGDEGRPMLQVSCQLNCIIHFHQKIEAKDMFILCRGSMRLLGRVRISLIYTILGKKRRKEEIIERLEKC